MAVQNIPVTLKPYFQEYVFENLDPDKDAFLVMERTLAWGEAPELRWLFARYGAQQLAAWVQQAGWRCLPQRRFKYWRMFFSLHDAVKKDRIWPH
ncbi:MAG TPA: hypothetical protein PKZ84_21670 [Anaerolineae bacterium]|nr:hypothetical protein [Anaerolineae bacterium]HQI87199.1 hypothetical protein [Anaerolineae bacterium]